MGDSSGSAAGPRAETVSIAVLGAGPVGRAIGGKWLKAGHRVTFGVRSPDARRDMVRETVGAEASVATVDHALAGAEVVLLALPAGAVEEVLARHADALDGLVVIDATNRLGDGPMHALDSLAGALPRADLYRAFNHLGWENFAHPDFGVSADLFYCGPQGESQKLVESLITDVGLRPVRVGDLASAGLLDGITRLWFALAQGQGYGRHLAFRTLT